MLADMTVYHFERMFKICHLWPGYYITISQYALDSALFNTKSPTQKNEQLKLPVLTQEVSETFSAALIGGYSSVNSVFHTPTNALLSDQSTSTSSFFDACR